MGGNLAAREIGIVIRLLEKLARALNVAGLYPHTHDIYKQAIQSIFEELAEYLQQNDALRLYVEEGAVSLEASDLGSLRMNATPVSASIIGLLARDGIKWIEFCRGIRMREISVLLKIFHRYRSLREEDEGDIVTALWEENLPHLRYLSKEIVWEAEPLTEFTKELEAETALLRREMKGVRMTSAPGRGRDGEEVGIAQGEGEDREEGSSGRGEDPVSDSKATAASSAYDEAATLDSDPRLWTLSAEELDLLREMVYAAENFDTAEGILNALMLILKQDGIESGKKGEIPEKYQEDMAAILDYLKEEFQNALEHGQFSLAFRLVRNIYELIPRFSEEKVRERELIQNFFREISAPEILERMNPYWPKIESISKPRLEAFQKNLMLLYPTAVKTFANQLRKTAAENVKELLMDIIAALSLRDMAPLEEICKTGDEELILALFPLLSKDREEDAFRPLLMDLLSHESPKLRSEALKTILEKYPEKIDEIFSGCMDDPDERVRWALLQYLGKEKNPFYESLMLAYLEEEKYTFRDQWHLLSCYRCLGKCGSDHSLTFLREILHSKERKRGAAQEMEIHRRGAAHALLSIGTPDALQIVNHASKSISRSTRNAALAALAVKR